MLTCLSSNRSDRQPLSATVSSAPPPRLGVLASLGRTLSAIFLNTAAGAILVPSAFGFLYVLGELFFLVGVAHDGLIFAALDGFLALTAPHTGLIAAILAPSWQLLIPPGVGMPSVPAPPWTLGLALFEGAISGLIIGRLFRAIYYPGAYIGAPVEDAWAVRPMVSVAGIALAGALASGCFWWRARRAARHGGSPVAAAPVSVKRKSGVDGP